MRMTKTVKVRCCTFLLIFLTIQYVYIKFTYLYSVAVVMMVPMMMVIMMAIDDLFTKTFLVSLQIANSDSFLQDS